MSVETGPSRSSGTHFAGVDSIINTCLHCGMCLPVCPTYALTSNEESSPRGRIRLMREAGAGNLNISGRFVNEMYFCLDCQACETACPAGVEYGFLVEEARSLITELRLDPPFFRWWRKFFLVWILSSRRRTRIAAAIARWYRMSGLWEAFDSSGLLRLFGERVHERHSMFPRIASAELSADLPEIFPAVGERKRRVGFLTGCVMNVTLPGIHRDAIDVLTRNGCEVIVPRAQICCGSLQAHYGETAASLKLGRQTIDLFESFDLDAVITDSAGCAAFMKDYGRAFQVSGENSQHAARFGSKVREVLEYLSEIGVRAPLGGVESAVTYHDPCHLVHTQGISSQPRDVIAGIPGLRFIELRESTWCCGSAGIYNLTRFEDSMKLLDRKMSHIVSTGAETVLTANPGCHVQLEFGARRCRSGVAVRHPVTLLSEAYRKDRSEMQ